MHCLLGCHASGALGQPVKAALIYPRDLTSFPHSTNHQWFSLPTSCFCSNGDFSYARPEQPTCRRSYPAQRSSTTVNCQRFSHTRSDGVMPCAVPRVGRRLDHRRICRNCRWLPLFVEEHYVAARHRQSHQYLGRSGLRTARRHAVDVVLQSRAPKYGSGWIYPQTAVGHGRVAFLLLAIVKNGGITLRY